MKLKALAGSTMVVALLGLGVFVGSISGAGSTSAQTSTDTPQSTAPKTAPSTAPNTAPSTAPNSAPDTAPNSAPSTAPSTAITQQQAEQTALAASPGNTVDHTRLFNDQNGTATWDVDFTNGGGATVDAQTGKIIATEAAGTDNGGKGGHMGGPGGADQAALAAKATVTKQQAEQTALTASPGNTVDHSRLGDNNGTIFWDVDFTNGGGATVDAQTGKIIATEAAGTDHGGRPGNKNGAPPATQP